jgi:hypothetical protein
MTKMKSKQSGIIVKHVNPTFMIEFRDEFIDVPDEVAEYLKKTRPEMFVFEEKEDKYKKSSFRKLPELKEKEGE